MDLIYCGEWYSIGGICLTDYRIYVSFVNDNGGKIGCYIVIGDLIYSIEKIFIGKVLFIYLWYIVIYRELNFCVSDKLKKCVLVVSFIGF